jgi:hypothetical protein
VRTHSRNHGCRRPRNLAGRVRPQLLDKNRRDIGKSQSPQQQRSTGPAPLTPSGARAWLWRCPESVATSTRPAIPRSPPASCAACARTAASQPVAERGGSYHRSSIIDHRSLVVCTAATVSSGVCPRGAHTPPAAAGVWWRDPGGSSSLRPCVRGAREGVVEPAEPVSHLHLRRHPLRRPAARRHLVSARRNTLLALSSATLVRGAAACFTYFTYFTSSSPPQRGRARVAAHRRSPHGLPASTMSTSGSRRPLAASLRSSTSSASGVCM